MTTEDEGAVGGEVAMVGETLPIPIEGSVASADSSIVEAIADPVLRTMAKLMQAQTEAMAAQARAVAVQHLPCLPMYSGEDRQITDDGFERWV